MTSERNVKKRLQHILKPFFRSILMWTEYGHREFQDIREDYEKAPTDFAKRLDRALTNAFNRIGYGNDLHFGKDMAVWIMNAEPEHAPKWWNIILEELEKEGLNKPQ